MAGKPKTWDTTASVRDVGSVDEDDGLTKAERVRSRLEGWDPVGLIWRRVKVDTAGALVTSGGGGGGGPATIADGADVAEGATTDAAVITDVSGTVSGKLRGLVKWAFERMPASLGQKTMANSLPVVLPSDQSAIPVTGSGVFHVDDNAGSLTVDAPVGTPVWVRLSDGAAAFVGQKAMAASIPVVIASDQSAITVAQGTPPWTVKGDQARASATIPNPVVHGLRAANYPTKPASVAAGQLVDAVSDLEGVIYTRPRQIATYVAIYRLALAAASSSLTFTFTANTDKQLATIYHAVGAAKRVVLRKVWVQILKTGAVAGEVQFELRTLSATTAPATGNPAITPAKRDQALAAAEATCLALPTTAGSEVAANSPLASSILNLAASVGTASGTGLLPQDPMWIKLYDESSADDEEISPIMRAATAEGYAVVGRSTAAVPLNFIVRIVFTEE